MYKTFLRDILHRRDNSDITEEELLWTQNLRLMKIAVFIVVGISIYWIAADLFLDTYNLSTAALCGVVAQLISSFYLFILIIRSKKPDYRLIRYSFLVYYAIMMISIGILTFSRNLNIVNEGSYSPYIGISISTFYLFILAIIPMPGKKDLIALCIWMFICLVTPDIVVHSSDYSLLSHILLGVCFATVILFDRSFFLQNFSHEIEISKLSDEMLIHSVVDSLTGSLNRRAMDDYIDYLIKEPDVSCVGVLFFDVDYFKKYNDYYGHVEGDRILAQLVKVANKSIAEDGASYLFRYGGEEFIILMENASEAKLIDTMTRIKDDVFDADIPRKDIDIFDRVTITIGGAIEKIPNETGDYVMAADSQLYMGKAAYRNAAYFRNRKVDGGKSYARNVLGDTSPNRQSKAWLFESNFHEAIDNNEFTVWCQPQYDATESFMLGGEALVRWQRPDGTMISPGEFIPVFESDGLITILDEYMFRYVCRRQKELLDKGLGTVPVSVNMSRATLFSPSAIDSYLRIVEETGVPKKLVPIEITESTAADSDIIRKLTYELKDAGFSIYMDDFGSGYFSLSNLSELPFDSVKLDKSLIDNIGNEKGDEVLKHIVELAHYMNMHVVAEGVERKEQLNFARKLNCDMIQGFYFSKPVPYEDFLSELTSEAAQARIAEYNAKNGEHSIDIGSLRITNDMKLQYLSALGNIYMTLHVIDLDKDTTVEFTTTVNVKEHVNKSTDATEQIRQAMIHTVAPEHIPYALDFTDLTTLKERMRGKRYISREFNGIHFGWFRAQFITVSSDDEDIPHTVLFTTQVITADKESEKKLLKECRTDELTGVYNKRAYIEDSSKYDVANEDIVVMLVKTLGLRKTNTALGHAAGDELLRGTTECLTEVFGKNGTVYRIDNAEFAVISDEGSIDVKDVDAGFGKLVSAWMGNNVKRLEVAYGFASEYDYPGSTVGELCEHARAAAAALAAAESAV